MNEYEEKILANIERYGCSVTSVVDREGDEPPFTYSIGIARSSGAPELVVVGLTSQVGHGLVNDYNERVRAGERFVPGVLYEKFLKGRPVQFRGVSRAQREGRMLSAVWLHGGADFEALQLVWPDGAGKWPWDEAVDAEVRRLQPVLDGVAD